MSSYGHDVGRVTLLLGANPGPSRTGSAGVGQSSVGLWNLSARVLPRVVYLLRRRTGGSLETTTPKNSEIFLQKFFPRIFLC